MSYTTWDIETSIRTSYKRKANPFDRENFVVMQGWKRSGGKVEHDYFGRAGNVAGPGLPADWFTKLLTGTTLLVGTNIKFDLLYALQDQANRDAWMDWVAAGNTIWDCQLAEYLLEGMTQENHMLSLDELAPRYGGNVKFDEVKALWASGVSTEDINPDLLHRYLVGTEDEHGDIGNTELVFLGQVARARACGQLKSLMMNMGSLLYTIEAELNGMAVDIATGRKQAAELEQRIAEVSLELAQYIPDDLPFEFNWNSSRQKSAIIFGGQIPYKKRCAILDDHGNPTYAQMDAVRVVCEDGSLWDNEWWEHCFYTEWGQEIPEGKERVTFKSGKNKGEFKTKKVKVNDPDKPKSRLEDFLYTFPRITEPNKRWEGAVPGVYSTAAEVITELADREIPFLEALGKVTSLTKDLTTYYISTDPDTGESKGMLTLVQADGIIHHMLNHTSTVTGRFSSSNPNLQNLPKGGKSNVKALFVSRFKDGKVIQSDFSSLEVYVQAILTRCKQLIEDLRQGLDMHCVRVSQKEGIEYEVALAKCKDEDHPDFPVWNVKRTKAKEFSFQRAYGAGAEAISQSTKVPKEEIEALIKAEEARYPEIPEFYDELTEELKETAQPNGKVLYHPDIQGLVCYIKTATWRAPDGKLYAWKQHPAPEYIAKKGTSTSFSPPEIQNYPVQGTGGEWAKAAMWLAVRAYYARRNFEMKALLVNQVHDACYTDAAPEVSLEAAALLHACMEEASTFMEWYFDWEIPVAVPSDTTWGASMLEERKPPQDEFLPLVSKYRAEVRATYIGNHTPSCEQQLQQAA